MPEFIFDAGPLITACKFDVAGRLVIDYILDHCQINIAASVRDEVVIAGARYPDAQAAQQRINGEQITVLVPPSAPDLERLLVPYGLGDGEQFSILLTEHTALNDAILVIDDHLGYLVSDRLGRRKRFLLDVIADLANAGEMSREVAVKLVQAIRPRYPPAFVEHTLLLLQR